MSLDDTHYLNPGGKTHFRAVFSHSWIGFLNRASPVRILPGPHQMCVVVHASSHVNGDAANLNCVHSKDDQGQRDVK